MSGGIYPGGSYFNSCIYRPFLCFDIARVSELVGADFLLR